MAQTKTSSSRSSNSRGTRSSGSRSGSRGSRSNSRSSSRSGTRTPGRRSGSQQKGTSTISKIADKAKVPAIAGGAALVGFAGGLALKNGKSRGLSGRMPSLPKPEGSTVKVLGGAAKELAKGGYAIGQLTSEVKKVREAVETKDTD
jgi:hypothetical protein